MVATLPADVEAMHDWTWEDFAPFFDELQARELNEDTVHDWLKEMSHVADTVSELLTRASLAHNQNTADEAAETHFKRLMAEVNPPLSKANTELSKKLVDSGLKPDGFEIPLKRMEASIALFRDENLPLIVQENEHGMAYSKLAGAQTVEWEGEELTLVQFERVLQDNDRDTRKKAWHLAMDRRLQDREAMNDIWSKLFTLRQQIAENAGHANYRDYTWQDLKRFDYTPADCETFHKAIEEVVVPAAMRANERRQQRLGVETLRPWDLSVDPSGDDPLRPYDSIEDFELTAQTVFDKVDPKLGEYYAALREKDMLDLPNRKNKRPGAFCTSLPLSRSPFVFMNAAGMQGDVRTLLHEVGHAFHGFEIIDQGYYTAQRRAPMEFNEVASMAMELLAAPYLLKSEGGYYSEADAARDRVQHLEKIIFFWPYMAVVDGFQQWAYTSGDAAADPANCDAKWVELWDRFIKVDYSGLDDVKATGWHRKQHIFRRPFYYVEYGLAQLGAVQIWANALEDQAGAVRSYRKALALGGTANIPELYKTAGAHFAFDTDTLGQAVALIERTITELEA